MTWTDVTPITAGSPVSKATYFDPVSTDLNIVGKAWTDDTASRSSSAIWTTTSASLGNGTLVSRYRLAGKTLDWMLSLTFGSSTAPGSSQFAFSYPAGVSPLNSGAVVLARIYDNSASTTYVGLGVLNSATVNLNVISSAAGAVSNVTSTVPMTWGTSDVVAFLLTGLEVA